MKSLNVSLLAGFLICALMIFAAFFPNLISGQGPYVMQSMRSWIEDGSLNFERAPFSPSPEHPLGTDELGRDIWSRIVHGTRLTLGLGILVVAGRFLLAVPIALSAGFGGASAKSALRLGGIVFSAIPALLFSLIILQQEFFVDLSKGGSVAAFVIVLSGVGWAKPGLILANKTDEILRQPFILSERAIGKGGLRIVLDNVLPHLAPEATVLFFMELARALSMIMQLGVFGVFVGNLRVVKTTDGGVIQFFDVSFEPEWAGMLGTARTRLSTAPWMVIWPTLVFFISVFGFNLLGEGLRRKFQQSERLVSERSQNRFKNVYRVILPAAVLLLSLAIVTPRVYREALSPALTPLSGVLPEAPIYLGTDKATDAAASIASLMKSLGMEPLRAGSSIFNEFIHEYETPAVSLLESSSFILGGSGEPDIVVDERDFHITSIVGDISSIELVDTAGMDLFSPVNSPILGNKLALIDSSLYSSEGIDWILKARGRDSNLRGGIMFESDSILEQTRFLNADSEKTHISVSSELGEVLKSSDNCTVSISAGIQTLENRGRNIAGLIRGTDPSLKGEYVMVCLGYNSQDPGAIQSAEFGMGLMKQIAERGQNRRSYIFMFLDGTSSDRYHGFRAYEEDSPVSPADVAMCLDLTGLNSGSFEILELNTEQAPITRYYAWSTGYMLTESLAEQQILSESIPVVNHGGSFSYENEESANFMFWKHGIASIRIACEGSGEHSLDELFTLLAKTLETNDY